VRLFSSLPFRAWLDAWGTQRGRLLLAVSVSLSLGLLTLVWSFTWQRLESEKALTRANAQVQQQNLTAIISENLAQVLDRGRLMAITAESWFDGQDSGAAARMSAMIAADRTFLRVALYDDQLRRVYASSTGRDSPELRGALAEFLRAPPIQGATRLGLAPLPLASEQAWQIPLMVPVLGPSDRPSGVLLVVLDLGYFLQLYHHIDIGRTGRIQVLRLDGQIVAEARQEGLVLQKPGAGNPYLQSVTQAQGAVEADLYRDGRHHLSSYQQPHQMPFRVVVSREMGDILAVHQATRERFLGVLSLVSALFLGATFWVTQGIRRQGRYATALAQADQDNRALITQLEEEKRRAFVMAAHDPLTGLPNRRMFNELLSSHLQQAKRNRKHYALMYMDLDHFKTINDELGHLEGDRALAEFAHVVKAQLRATDVVGRLGGEEFCVLLPLTAHDQAIEIATRIMHGVACTPLTDETGRPYRITVSVGVGTISPHDRSLRDVLDRADQALYLAKNRGRNQIAIAPVDGSPT